MIGRQLLVAMLDMQLTEGGQAQEMHRYRDIQIQMIIGPCAQKPETSRSRGRVPTGLGFREWGGGSYFPKSRGSKKGEKKSLV